jgi:hypothetical protein
LAPPGTGRHAAVARSYIKHAASRLKPHVTMLTHLDVTPVCPFVITGVEKSPGVFSAGVATF